MGQKALIGAGEWNHQEMLLTVHWEGEGKYLCKPQGKVKPLPSTEQYGAAALTET